MTPIRLTLRASALALAAVLAVAPCGPFPVLPAMAEQPAPTAADKAGWYHEADISDYAAMKDLAVLPKRDDVTIVDSRPVKKYSAGHIPGAISLPDSQFAKLAPEMLPKDKGAALVFYCGGYACKLSHKSAFAAEKMGYTNIKVYAAGYPDWLEKGGNAAIDTGYLRGLMAGEAPLVVIDSRPVKKADAGMIPRAINIPDAKFAALQGILPADKAVKLVFYCGGFICKLSDDSANKAKALGYGDVVTYPAGYPAWTAEVGVIAKDVPVGTAGAAAAPAEAVKPGEGTVPLDEFKAILAKMPADVMIVDVRDADEFKRGAIRGSVNIPVGTLEDKLFDLPDDKRIIFVCTSGGRSGEAYDLSKLLRPDLNVAYIDAVVKYAADGTAEVTAH